MSWYRRKPIPRKSTQLSCKIAGRLIADGFLEGSKEDFCIRRCYVGHWQRSAGAWVWVLELIDVPGYVRRSSGLSVGSQWPAAELVRYRFKVIPEFGTDLALVPDEAIA